MIKGIWAALLLVSVGVLYVTHREVPFMMDDLWYSTMLSNDAPISSLKDIVESQIWHYHNWGGRSVTHGILQLTLLAGETIADILNVLVTLLLAYVVCLVAGYRTLPAFVGTLAMLLGCNANWKMSMFWQAGAANYLYITIFVLFFLYCYLRELPGGRDRRQTSVPLSAWQNGEAVPRLVGIGIWILPLGLIAGWSNENMGPAVWILSLLVILWRIREKQRVKPWMILGNLSCLSGSILVVTAPGNFVRSTEAAHNDYGIVWNFFLRCYGEAQAALNYLFPVLLLLAGVLILGKGVLKLPIGRQNGLLLLGAVLSWGAMVLSPHYPDRATFGTMVLMICVILNMTRKILGDRRDLGFWLCGAFGLIWLRGMFYLGEYLALCWGWIR